MSEFATPPSHSASVPLRPEAAKYLKDIYSPFKLRMFFLTGLPTAWWWGLRVKSASVERAEVSIPYNWRTRNPFKSIYFAALAGAGELSTGVLANAARLGKGNISLLVLEQRAEFTKKAVGTTTFTCEDGLAAFEAVQKAIDTKQPQTVTMLGTGRNTAGDVVARVYITWTYKAK